MRLRRPHYEEQREQTEQGPDQSAREGIDQPTRDVPTGQRSATVPAQRGDEERERRREQELGGFKIGAAFFGWLVAVGLMILLTGILAAIVAAFGASLDVSPGEAGGMAVAIGIGTGIALLLVNLISYFGGGYVAGRLARYKGARQGFGVWLIGLVVTLVVAALGAIFGSQYNVYEQAQMPAIPSAATVGGLIWLALLLLATLAAAMLGGKAGQRYHKKIDRTPV